MTEIFPLKIILHKQSRQLEVQFNNNENFILSAEYLRVYSPSAEVQGHHPSQAVLQKNKQHVAILKIEPVGHYAIKIIFDDGHASGIYSWETLYDLGKNHEQYWQDYLTKLRNDHGK